VGNAISATRAEAQQHGEKAQADGRRARQTVRLEAKTNADSQAAHNLLGFRQHADNLLGHAGVGGGEEAVGLALLAGARRPPDAVHIVLRGAGHVVVEHALDVLHVCGRGVGDTAGGFNLSVHEAELRFVPEQACLLRHGDRPLAWKQRAAGANA